MANFNQCTLCGHLCRDWEIRYTPSQTAVASNSIAITRKWKDGQGQQQEETSFLDLEIWAKGAEIINQYSGKGSPILVSCRAKQERWEDRESGQKRSRIKFVIEDFQFLSKRDDDNSQHQNAPGDGQQQQPRQQQRSSPPPQQRRAPEPEPEYVGEEDIPY